MNSNNFINNSNSGLPINSEEFHKVWLARDEGGYAFIHKDKPIKNKEKFGQWESNYPLVFDTNEFPNVKWEDEEPTEVSINIVSKGCLWHGYNEKPKDNSHIIIGYGNITGILEYKSITFDTGNWENLVKDKLILRWAYIIDLLSSNK